jgi:hypothetical protein
MSTSMSMSISARDAPSSGVRIVAQRCAPGLQPAATGKQFCGAARFNRCGDLVQFAA